MIGGFLLVLLSFQPPVPRSFRAVRPCRVTHSPPQQNSFPESWQVNRAKVRLCSCYAFGHRGTWALVRPIITFPNDILTSTAKYVSRFDKELADLVHDLLETLYDSDGVGLAAPQIGVSRRVFVMDICDGDEPLNPIVFINPILLVKTGSAIDEEGCLSMPGVYLPVRRATYIVCAGQTLDGTHFSRSFHSLEARVIQHELDHLSGVMFTQRAETAAVVK